MNHQPNARCKKTNRRLTALYKEANGAGRSHCLLAGKIAEAYKVDGVHHATSKVQQETGLSRRQIQYPQFVLRNNIQVLQNGGIR